LSSSRTRSRRTCARYGLGLTVAPDLGGFPHKVKRPPATAVQLRLPRTGCPEWAARNLRWLVI